MNLIPFRKSSNRTFAAILVLTTGIAALQPDPAHAIGGGRLDAMSDAHISGEAPNDLYGTSVAMVGDVNGDGFADMVIGAPANGATDAGAAYLVLGDVNGWGLRRLANQSPSVKYTGQSAGDRAGTSVAAAGDVNGDGFDDFLVGSPARNDGLGANQGSAYLVLGSATPTAANLSTQIKYGGESAGDLAGSSTSAAGDVNGDGFADFLVGSPARNDGAGANQGAAYLVLGSAAPSAANLSAFLTYSGEAAGDLAGTSLGAVGDYNGDGLADYLVGSPGNTGSAGAAYLVQGNLVPTAGILGTAPTFSMEFRGEVGGDQAGGSVSGAGDVNGDGFDDVLVAAKLHNPGVGAGAGVVYLLLGPLGAFGPGTSSNIALVTNASKYTGEAAGENAGTSVASAGDVNGDDFADFLIGAPFFGSTDRGATYAVLGSSDPAGGALGNAVRLTGQQNNDQSGNALAGGRDVDGDGIADILVGGYHNDIIFSEAGGAYVIFGDEPTLDNYSYRQRHNTVGVAGTNNFPVTFEPAGVRIDFDSGVLRDGDVSVRRDAFNPCTRERRLQLAIWTIDSGKFGAAMGSATIRFKYNNAQLGGATEANLRLWTRPAGQPCATWVEILGSTLDVTHNVITVTVTSFGQYTIAESPPQVAAAGDPAARLFLAAPIHRGDGSFIIRYELPTNSESVSLALYDVRGRRVRVLEAGRRESGVYEHLWNGQDERGARTPHGIYFVQLRSGSEVAATKLWNGPR
jgi:hypothetical protein